MVPPCARSRPSHPWLVTLNFNRSRPTSSFPSKPSLGLEPEPTGSEDNEGGAEPNTNVAVPESHVFSLRILRFLRCLLFKSPQPCDQLALTATLEVLEIAMSIKDVSWTKSDGSSFGRRPRRSATGDQPDPAMAITMKSLLERPQLSVTERILLVEEIWDSIAASPEQVPLTEVEATELDRRLVAYEADPGVNLTVGQSGRIGRSAPSEGDSSVRAMIADKNFGKLFKSLYEQWFLIRIDMKTGIGALTKFADPVILYCRAKCGR